jgi:transcriptional regulator with GAF, ATPase, and Fis domain
MVFLVSAGKGEGNAADRLGLKLSTLRSRMKRLGIARNQGTRRSELVLILPS